MIKQRKRTIKYSLAALSALLAVLCVVGLLFALYANKEAELARVQAEALALLDSREGEYDAQRIVLRGTSHKEAERLASRIGATLRITANGEFATLALPEGVTVRDVYENSENREALGLMSPDFFVSPSDFTPTRPDYSVSDTEYQKQTYLDYINIGNTWEISKGSGVTVAVIDTGIDTDHPEFIGKISEYSYNATTDKVVKDYGDWSLVEDSYGHGTAVCGVISASLDGAGTVGIAPEAELLIIKVESNASGGFYRSSDVAFGVYYAIEQGADVINMSLSGNENNTKEATRLAAELGIICVAAAGNSTTNVPSYPAADENVIGVGALAENSYELADYSNYGDNTTVVAAGTVYTTLIGGSYGKKEGTSFACPSVSAAVALYLSQNKDASFEDVLRELKISSHDLGNGGNDSIFGYGLLDVSAFVCEERGTLTLDMCTNELESINLSFVRNNTLQTLPALAREGYVFEGWYYDKELTKPMRIYRDTFTSDLTLYAKWTELSDYSYKYTEREDGTLMIIGYTGNQKNVIIPEYIDGKRVTAIGGSTFVRRTEIESMEIPSSVNLLDGTVFFGASSIKSFSLSDGESESFSVIDGVLFDKSEKTLVAYPAGREGEYDIPSRVRYIGPCAFAYSKITTVDLSGISSIGSHAFVDTNLKNLSIPYGVTYMGIYAFAANTKLETLRLSRSTVTVHEYAFAYCINLKTLSIPAGVLELRDHAFYQNISLQTVEFERNCSLALIHEYAFAECGIKELSFPQSMVSISENAFYKNTDLTAVGFAEGSKLSLIDAGAFAECESLAEFMLPDSLIKIGEKAFKNTAVADVTLPASLTYLGVGAFAECSQLQTISAETASTVCISVDGVLYNADKTSILAYPAGRDASEYTIEATATSVGEAAFSGAKKLKKINLPSSLSFIGREAFRGSGLNEVNITESITHIGAYAFAGLENLKEFKVAENHGKYTALGGSLYSKDGKKLIAVPASIGGEFTLSDTVTAIDFGAFENSTLEKISIHAGVKLIAEDAFKNSGAVVYCREGTAAHRYAEANLDSYIVRNETTPYAPELASVGETALTLVAREGYEYRLDGGEWQSSNVFTGLIRGTSYTFYQREAQTDHKEASIESTAVSFETLDHSFGKLVEKIEADCEREGSEAHYLCANCGGYFTADKEPATKDALTIPKTEHSYGEDDICDICQHDRTQVFETTDTTLTSDTAEKPIDSDETTDTQSGGNGCRSIIITVPISLIFVISLSALVKREDD